MYLDKHKLFVKSNIDNLCEANENLNFKELVKTLITQENKLKEINDRGARHKTNQAKEKEKEKLTKNEKERLKLEEEKKTLEKGKNKDSSVFNTNKLRTRNIKDLSSNLNAQNKSQLSIKKTKSNLKSTL